MRKKKKMKVVDWFLWLSHSQLSMHVSNGDFVNFFIFMGRNYAYASFSIGIIQSDLSNLTGFILRF